MTISGLSHTIYYVRAYAKSSAGVVYGIVLQTNPDHISYLALPTFIHAEETYRVHPEFSDAMEWNWAMSTCANLTYGGYSDWVLPTIDILYTMYLYRNEIGGFSDSYYWSSTERSSSEAWCWVFYAGSQATDLKTYSHRVRCVRKEN